MPIFSRRDVQRMLDDLSAILRPQQAKSLARRLNLRTSEALSAEWELAVTHSLLSLGQVSYEKDSGGESLPDVHFLSREEPDKNFVAEVTTISDRAYDDENPYDHLVRAFGLLAGQLGVKFVGFSFDVGGSVIGSQRTQRMKLSLPDKSEIPRFVSDEFRAMIEAVARDPSIPQQSKCRDRRFQVVVSYQPDFKTIAGRHPSYEVFRSREGNTLYNALKAKAKQLKASGFPWTKGIIACDGGTTALIDRSGGGDAFSLRDVVARFFQNYGSVGFVLILRTAVEHAFFNARRSVKIEGLLLMNGYVGPLSENLSGLLCSLPSRLPIPIDDSYFARARLRDASGRLGRGVFGGYTVSNSSIQISARAVHALLAGSTMKNFLKRTTWRCKFFGEPSTKEAQSALPTWNASRTRMTIG